MKVKVSLLGYGEKKEAIIEASTPLEAIKGFILQTEVLQKPKPGYKKHELSVVDLDYVEDLVSPLKENMNIILVPTFSGGSSGKALAQIGIGAALIMASFYVPGSWAITTQWGAITAGGMIFNVGVALVLGGLIGLLSPSPELEQSNVKPSKLLGVPKNTVGIGTPIPVLYGEHKVYGHILAFDIDSVNTKKNV